MDNLYYSVKVHDTRACFPTITMTFRDTKSILGALFIWMATHDENAKVKISDGVMLVFRYVDGEWILPSHSRYDQGRDESTLENIMIQGLPNTNKFGIHVDGMVLTCSLHQFDLKLLNRP